MVLTLHNTCYINVVLATKTLNKKEASFPVHLQWWNGNTADGIERWWNGNTAGGIERPSRWYRAMLEWKHSGWYRAMLEWKMAGYNGGNMDDIGWQMAG